MTRAKRSKRRIRCEENPLSPSEEIALELTYKLLTPGPLTTTRSVKEQMLFDHCTWDDDYKRITQDIRAHLLRLAHVAPRCV